MKVLLFVNITITHNFLNLILDISITCPVCGLPATDVIILGWKCRVVFHTPESLMFSIKCNVVSFSSTLVVPVLINVIYYYAGGLQFPKDCCGTSIK